jgi:hypothetical protein
MEILACACVFGPGKSPRLIGKPSFKALYAQKIKKFR